MAAASAASDEYNIALEEENEVDCLSKPTGRSFLVTGGSGFLGKNIVEALLIRGDKVRVFDLVQSIDDARVEFFRGDIRSKADLVKACTGIDTVFHVASLTDPWAPSKEYFNVNVAGTRFVIEACLSCGVTQLVYTSTASVVIDGSNIQNGDEASLPYPSNARKYLDQYSASKAQAERLVIAANGILNVNRQPLLTCSLRPHALFGPGDQHFVARLLAKARNGDITHMIGNGENMVDFTFVENAAIAHLQASHKLVPGSPVGGQCYFITNGEPVLFWDFIGYLLNETGCAGPTKYISFSVAYAFAYVMDWLHWLLGWVVQFSPTITRHMVCTMAQHHWFSHAKATRDFGYRPLVSLDEALERTIAHFVTNQNNISTSGLHNNYQHNSPVMGTISVEARHQTRSISQTNMATSVLSASRFSYSNLSAALSMSSNALTSFSSTGMRRSFSSYVLTLNNISNTSGGSLSSSSARRPTAASTTSSPIQSSASSSSSIPAPSAPLSTSMISRSFSQHSLASLLRKQ